MPKKEHTTLQTIGNLADNSLDLRRNRSQHEKTSHVLSTSKPLIPMHFYMVQSFNLQIYNEAIGNVGNINERGGMNQLCI
jgi:hypothetical protein